MRSSSIASTILLSLASAAIVFAAPISDKRGEKLACIPIPPRSTEVCTGEDCVHCPPGTYPGVPYVPPEEIEKRKEDFGICTVHCDAQGICYESGPGCDASRNDQLIKKREEEFGICTVHCNAEGICYESGPGCDASRNDQLIEKRFHPCTVHCDAQGICYESGPGCDAARNDQLIKKREEDFGICTVHCNAEGICYESGPGCDAARNDQLIKKRD